jgi:asparagine synthase (glutamine-hydrolysing)
MISKFRTLISLYRHFGLRWLLYRFIYAVRVRTGLIRLQMPAYQWTDRPLSHWLKSEIPSAPEKYFAWRQNNPPEFFLQPVENFPKNISWDSKIAINEADKILSGEFKYFEHTFYKTGFPPNWFADPVSGQKLPANQLAYQISDDNDFDIKFVWEASRFSFVYVLMRAYAATQNEKYAEAFWSLVEDWAQKNIPGYGPNWKDGQEAALRLTAWCVGWYAFRKTESATPARIAQMTVLIAAHAERILKNVDYAISTRGNHSISEALGLYLAGMLFPEIKNSEKYSSFGKKLLEREAAAQIFPDGSYAMYSLNYHRFVLHVYLYAMRLGEIHHAPFSDELYRAVAASINLMSQLVEADGSMPVFGSNDGALVSPLTNCDFSDYRPLLQAGYFFIHRKKLFASGAWDEALFWLFGAQALQSDVEKFSQSNQNYPDGGITILRSGASKAVIRCVDFRERPSHADQLHVDLWLRGKNIAVDAGTYLYNARGIWRNGLARASVHNTVTVDDLDQMTSFSRFTWIDWAQGRTLQTASSSVSSWRGAHDGYLRLIAPARHTRSVLFLDEERCVVIDQLESSGLHHYRLHWLLEDFPYEQNLSQHSILLKTDSGNIQVRTGTLTGDSTFSIVRADESSTRGWRSIYYGHKQPALSLALESNQLQCVFWTFFGLEDDVVEVEGNILAVRMKDKKINIEPGFGINDPNVGFWNFDGKLYGNWLAGNHTLQ